MLHHDKLASLWLIICTVAGVQTVTHKQSGTRDFSDNFTWLPPEPTRIKSWYHLKFQLILAKFSPLIPKLCSDKSESGGKWILVSHWLISIIWRILNQWWTRIHFPPLSDLSEHSLGISGLYVARISWNFEWYQFFILMGPGGNREIYILLLQLVT